MNDTNSPRAAIQATYALAWIGPDAMSVFAATLADTDSTPDVRNGIVYVMGEFPNLATNSVSSVTLLVQCLQDANPPVREWAILSLGQIGAQNRAHSGVAVHALTNFLRADFPLITRKLAVRSLGSYSNEAGIAVPLLLDLIDSPDSDLRVSVTNALMSIAPEVLTNAPAK